jgi:hypothetical protein
MTKKLTALTLSVLLGISVFTGCSSSKTAQKPAEASAPAATEAATPAATEAATPAATEAPKADAVSSASMATDNDSFKKAISKDGNWIVLTDKDLTFTEDLVVDGELTHKGHDGKDATGRSLAFATSKEDHSVDKRFTVTTPNFVINSSNTLLEDGIVKGDVYVQAPGFTTSDAVIEGNLYFATQELKDAFKIDPKTKVSGTTDVKAYAK